MKILNFADFERNSRLSSKFTQINSPNANISSWHLGLYQPYASDTILQKLKGIYWSNIEDLQFLFEEEIDDSKN